MEEVKVDIEINGLELSPEAFVYQMNAYCSAARGSTSFEEMLADGTIARENYMASKICEAMKTNRRVLVVTGGFHSPGLYELITSGAIRPPKLHRIPADCTGCYPAAYSYEAADALHGYSSGMRYPYFCDCIFKRVTEKGVKRAYDAVTLDLLTLTSKEASKRDIPVSTADVTAALSLMRGLAALRGIKECGITELADGITGAFIKGEKTVSSSMPLDILSRLAVGSEIGHIGNAGHIPPLIADFIKQCEKFSLHSDISVPQTVECGLFTSAKGLQISRFLHRMSFLETGFCERVKGPRLREGRDRSRVREEWKYHRSPAVDAALIDNTTNGFTIEEACRNVSAKRLISERRSEAAAGIAVDCFLMGISIEDEYSRLSEIIMADGDFFSTAQAMRNFRTLYELRKLYEYDDNTSLPLMELCFDRMLTALPGMADIPDDRAAELISAIRVMFSLTDTVLSARRRELRSALDGVLAASDKQPAVYGAVLGLLCTDEPEMQKTAEYAMRSFLKGSVAVKKQGAEFLKGLFETARDIVFAEGDFIRMTDELITGMENEDFMEILPSLRLAFGYFTPQEISETARSVAALYSVGSEEVMLGGVVDEGLFAFGRTLDNEIYSQMKETYGCNE